MTERCELYIARLNGGEDENKIVRIEARVGPRLLGRIDVRLEDFAAATMGTAAVPSTFTTTREARSPMTERETINFYVETANGLRLEGTKSSTPEEASAKAMMMDIPRGCCIVRAVGEKASRKEGA